MDESSASAAVSEAAAQPISTFPRQLHFAFTGTGSEYFRIWIVNLLLILVTLGLYFPWAKVRRLRYFCGNTLVDGDPLGFHGDPRKMFKGFALVGVLFALYSVAGRFSAISGFFALLVVVAIWPALFKSSLQFRLANTSWRGLRFRFHGSLADAYRANVPLFIPGVLLGSLSLGMNDPKNIPNDFNLMFGLAMLLSLLTTPWLFWNLKQYQHRHYGLGVQQTQFRARAGSFYLLFLKMFALAVLVMVLTIGAMVAAAAVFGGNLKALSGAMPKAPAVVFFGVLSGLLGMAMVMIGIKPYAVSRMQNLVWSRTGNASMQFVSTLRFRSILWLTLKNWLWIILTLGMYWPFASVAMTRMRLQAVSISSRINPEELTAHSKSADGDAAGDAAGDFFGLDIGL